MKKSYLIVVPDMSIDESKISYSDLIDWSYQHLSHSNVLLLNKSDIDLLESGKGLDIINKENSSMIGYYEDDWILSNKIKRKIITKLNIYKKSIKDKRELNIISKIIDLLEISIETNKNIYFIF